MAERSSACLLTVVVPDIPQSAEKVHLIADTKQGFCAMCGNKPLMAAFFPILVASMLYQPLGALYPLLVRSHYQGEVWHIGIAPFVFSGGLLVSSPMIGV